MGTKIQLHFGDTVIPAALNDSTAAKEFLAVAMHHSCQLV